MPVACGASKVVWTHIHTAHGCLYTPQVVAHQQVYLREAWLQGLRRPRYLQATQVGFHRYQLLTVVCGTKAVHEERSTGCLTSVAVTIPGLLAIVLPLLNRHARSLWTHQFCCMFWRNRRSLLLQRNIGFHRCPALPVRGTGFTPCQDKAMLTRHMAMLFGESRVRCVLMST